MTLTSEKAEEIKTLLSNEDNPLVDNVWIGTPSKIPQSFNTIAIIEPLSSPEYQYTLSRNVKVFKFTDFYITITTKGKNAFMDNWDTTDQIEELLKDNPKLNNKCIDSTLEETLYGTPRKEEFGKGLMAGSRITLRCKDEI